MTSEAREGQMKEARDEMGGEERERRGKGGEEKSRPRSFFKSRRL